MSVNNSMQLINELNKLNTKDNIDEQSREYRIKIGKWGETFVNEILQKQFGLEEIVKVEWMNKHSESGLPYDFRLIKTKYENKSTQSNFSLNDDFLEDDTVVQYIEVKSTIKPYGEEAFPISYNELLFATQHSSKYQIYRIYNAGTNDLNNVKIKVISDLPSLLNSHDINLYIVV